MEYSLENWNLSCWAENFKVRISIIYFIKHWISVSDFWWQTLGMWIPSLAGSLIIKESFVTFKSIINDAVYIINFNC